MKSMWQDRFIFALARMYLNGINVVKNAKRALIYYQKAEEYIYQVVKHGKRMCLKSLQTAIYGQVKARMKSTFALLEQARDR